MTSEAPRKKYKVCQLRLLWTAIEASWSSQHGDEKSQVWIGLDVDGVTLSKVQTVIDGWRFLISYVAIGKDKIGQIEVIG